jgi:hypothetical protein
VLVVRVFNWAIVAEARLFSRCSVRLEEEDEEKEEEEVEEEEEEEEEEVAVSKEMVFSLSVSLQPSIQPRSLRSPFRFSRS